MVLDKIAAFARSPWYNLVAAGVSCASGVAAGVAYEMIHKEADSDIPLEDYPLYAGNGRYVRDGEEAEDVVEETAPSFAQPKAGSVFEKPGLEDMVDYTKYYSSPKAGAHAAEETDEKGKVDHSVFEIISEAEFVSATGNPDGYVTATGTYFPESRILSGWNDKAEPKDVKTTIGEEAVMRFEDEDVEAVYVRNTALKVLYEVVRGQGLYEDEG